jgi:1-aminocyclopropane-1-carboxylate deaminase/D-cysteine desulfhydrase-like pyridoxal-dependent ACC family enzyme
MTEHPLSVETLSRRLAAIPRVPLAHLPTPLEPCPRFSKALGKVNVLIKRDDLTGLAFGGNKTRQLEFVFDQVLRSGADIVVAGAYTQSNWCRQITAAARKFGLDVSLVLARGVKGPLLQGNLLLDRILGAEVTILNVLDEELQPHLEAKAEALRGQGRKPFLISSFELGTQSLAALGYVETVVEIVRQLGSMGGTPDYLYVAGSEMSPAGLNVGVRALGLPTRVVSVSPIAYPEPRADEIARIATACAARLGLEIGFAPSDIIVDDEYIGESYGFVSDAGREAMMLLARTEGIILDPVYTSKAMAGLIGHARRGLIREGANVVFVHTGGLPALFAYAEDLGIAPPAV